MRNVKFECVVPGAQQFEAIFAAAEKAARDAAEVVEFAKRVRLPGSGAVARLFGRIDAWKAARVERLAQVAFERGWL